MSNKRKSGTPSQWVVLVFRTKRQRKPNAFIFSTKKDAYGFQRDILKHGAALASKPFLYRAEDWGPASS